jgi:predicted aconitase with swiveling domain
MSEVFPGRTVESGTARGLPFCLGAPLSFWGGFDAGSGLVVERGHPDNGASLKDRVLLMERAKGSSSSSSVLAEALRNGTGPCAMVMREVDLIIALGAIVARELYGTVMPIVAVDAAVWLRLCRIEGSLIVTAHDDGTASIRNT